MWITLLIFSRLLIPMDNVQSDHLKAYGLTYYVLKSGLDAEWLLNYRGGSFLLPDLPSIRKKASLMGVTYKPLSETAVQDIFAVVEKHNMERVLLEKAPKVAVYIPPKEGPWDDAVTLALDYAEIPYDQIWDEDIVKGKLDNYDWLHLHHEDFTGQYGKFYFSYHNRDWYKKMVRMNQKMAKKLGFKKVWQLKHYVAEKIKNFVGDGGFLFAMCSAPITLDIALASGSTDIVPAQIDGDGIDPNCQQKLNFNNTLAFTNFHLIESIFIYEHSDVDVTREAVKRGKNAHFTLRKFDAKRDVIPSILVQDHTDRIKEFLGQDTGFRRDKLKKNIVILGEISGTEETKYIFGEYGKGTFSFMGGHDPEDYAHLVGDPPTDLFLHKHSPGYRLILNNILFPAARKKRLKT